MKQFIRYTILCVGYILGSQSLLYAETPTDSINTIPTDSIIAKKDTTVKKLNIFQKVLKYFDDSNAPRPDKKFDFGIIGGPHYSSTTKLGIGQRFALWRCHDHRLSSDRSKRE